MENAAEAIKMAFAVFAFILAIGIAFLMFNQSKEVAEIVISHNDKTYLELYNEADLTDEGRVVGVESVLPTLYRYYKERYSVDIVKNGGIVEAFDLETEGKISRRTEGYYRDDWYIRTYNGQRKRLGELYPVNVHWIGSATNRDAKLRVDNYASNMQNNTTTINHVKNIRPNDQNFSFNDLYFQTFQDSYTGKKAYYGDSYDPRSSDYDGTYLIVSENGETKIHITYIKQ